MKWVALPHFSLQYSAMRVFAVQKLMLLTALLMAFSIHARAETIALAGPKTGTARIIAEQMQQGADILAPERSFLDTQCSSASGRSVAETAISLNIKLLIGLPCIEALEAAQAYITEQQSDMRIIALGVELARERRSNGGTDAVIYQLAADANAEADALAEFVRDNWRNETFALIDDGTLYGRLLAENVRAQLEEDNLKPIFVDNYRPLQERQTGLVRRLQRSGATHVIVGGDAYDASIIGADAALLNFNIIMAGGSAFRAPAEDGQLPDGTIYVAPEKLYTEISGSELRDYAVLTYAALEIANTAIENADTNETNIDDMLGASAFDTIIGPIRFNATGQNNRNWYRIYEVQNGASTPLTR